MNGLPGPLPAGERLLWQGKPDARALARQVFHVRGVALYLAAVVAWSGVSLMMAGAGAGTVALSMLKYAGLAALPVLLAVAYAWLMARTTTYTVTSKRVVLRIGSVLSVTINLPYAKIEGAALSVAADGTGNISLLLNPGERLAYLLLWPHARPWRLARAEPTLRGIPNAARVGQLVARALAASAGMPAPIAGDVIAPEGRPSVVPA